MRLALQLPALLFAALPASAQGLADLSFDPPTQTVPVGGTFEVRLVASAPGPQAAQIGSIEAILSYDPAVITLTGATNANAGYAWFQEGFLPDPDGINADIADGDALFTALSQLSTPATVIPGTPLIVTTLQFQANAASPGTTLSFLPTLGAFGQTRVFDFFTPGLDITGDISSTATIVVGTGGPTSFCEGTSAACPCGNGGGPGEGCGNSTGAGAVLSTSGSTSVSAADLVFSAAQLAPSQPGLYFQGNNAVSSGNGVPFGDGLRCAGGGVIRIQVRISTPSGTSQTTTNIVAATGVQPGDTKRYQIWYRDPQGSPCGTGFNLSNGIEVSWTP